MKLDKINFQVLENGVKQLILKNREIAVMEICKSSIKVIVYDNTNPQGISFTYTENMLLEDTQSYMNLDSVLLGEAISKIKSNLLREEFDLNNLTFVVAIASMAHVEVSEYPVLPIKELQEALAWEMPQHVSGEISAYEYRYIARKKAERIKKEELTISQEVTIYILSKQVINVIMEVFAREQLHLACLTVTESVIFREKDEEFLKDVEFFEGFYSKQKLEELRTEYRLLIMTAYCYSQGAINVNFLNKQKHYEAIYFYFKTLCKYVSCICWGASLVILIGMQGWKYYNLQSLENLQKELHKYDVWQKRMLETKQIDTEIKQLEEKIQYLAKSKIKWSEEIKRIASCLPEGCWLTKVEQDSSNENLGEGLILQGKAENLVLITKFLNKLKDNTQYEKVELLKSETAPNDQLINAAKLNFTIKFRFMKPNLEKAYIARKEGTVGVKGKVQ